ncbi:MAG TPA: protein kinase [Bryobacteraceae bacterium]|nr:protein kinase [Bryobacteraceae bacterium]
MIGEAVSHYEILDKLGEGGMGIVYKARDLHLHRLVALKFLAAEITATPERVARFELEARAISALNHPHIATIHAMEESGGRRYLVLEYLPGGTLRQRIKFFRAQNELFPLREAVRIAIETAEGLAHAHRRGIVHRDIKPENVMFTAEGALRITDFGLAKSETSDLTREGATVGTAAYMAPEQALRNETSPRSDLFSLGVMLYEMVAGQRPFSGNNEFSTMQAVVSDAPAPFGNIRSGIPPGLERIVLHLLDKDPARRYQTGEELAAELRALDLDAETETVELNYSGVTKTMLFSPQLDSRRRRTQRNWTLFAAAIVVLAAAAVFVWLRVRPSAGTGVTQIAVLPFTAKSAAPEDVAFGNGMASIVADRLSALGTNIWIIPENDLRQNRVANVTDARKIFGVRTAVTGTVERQVGGVVDIDMRLVDTASGKTVRSASVKSHGVATPLEEEVVKQAASMLDLSLDPLAVSKLRADATQTANAYDYYVLGNGYLQRYDQAGNIGSAIAAFQRAIQLDSSYAMAYAGLSSAYIRQYRNSSDQQYLEKARDAAIQALSRNESLDSPHITLGTIAMATGQTEEGIRQLKAALDRDPVNAEAYGELARVYVQSGRPAEAEATYNRAIQLRPGFWLGYFYSATFYNSQGRYAEAEKALKTAVHLTPDNYLVYRNLGGVQMARGEWADAEHSFREAIRLRPGGTVYSNLGTLYIYAGRYVDAIQVLEQAVRLAGSHEIYSHVIWGNLGDAYRWAGGREASAKTAYAKAVELANTQLAVNPNDATLLSLIAVWDAKMGNLPEALTKMRLARKLSPADSTILYYSAITLELAGQRGPALDALRAALASGYSLSVVEREPELISLRQDPRYHEAAKHAMEKK